jgi:hypothetical protein
MTTATKIRNIRVKTDKALVKTRKPFMTSQRLAQSDQRPIITGPLVILHGPSSREVMTLIRDALNIALGETGVRQVQPSPASEPLVSDWHRQPRSKGYTPTPASGPAKQKSFRSRIVEWITDYVGPREAGRTDDNYRIAYKEAYRQLMLRHGFDVEQRARNFARKYIQAETPVPAGNEPMDFVERLNMTEELFKIVCEMYPLGAVDPMMKSEPVMTGVNGLN